MALSSDEVLGLYKRHVVANYGRAPINIVKGEGSYVWDAEGRKYLDLLPGLGVNGLGHCPPRVVAAIKNQAEQLMHIHNNYLWEQQGLLARALASKTSGMGEVRTFFCNSGTEATEAGLKLARLWGKQHGNKWKIISLENGFHGRTYAAISATGQPALQKGIEPLLPGFSYIPINDAGALENAFDDETVAFLAEPVQGESGINPCTRAFLEAARTICDKRGALLLYDEVQCGMGRTGDYFAYQTLGAPAPDVLWLAKALGGGFPMGATMARPEVASALAPGTHGSTFGGNPVACAAGLAVMETIDAENLLDHVREMSAHLEAGLRKLQERFPDKVRQVRIVGLMVGIDLTTSNKPVVEFCREHGLLINGAHDTVVRLLPAMNVARVELDEGLGVLAEALAALR